MSTTETPTKKLSAKEKSLEKYNKLRADSIKAEIEDKDAGLAPLPKPNFDAIADKLTSDERQCLSAMLVKQGGFVHIPAVQAFSGALIRSDNRYYAELNKKTVAKPVNTTKKPSKKKSALNDASNEIV